MGKDFCKFLSGGSIRAFHFLCSLRCFGTKMGQRGSGYNCLLSLLMKCLPTSENEINPPHLSVGGNDVGAKNEKKGEISGF